MIINPDRNVRSRSVQILTSVLMLFVLGLNNIGEIKCNYVIILGILSGAGEECVDLICKMCGKLLIKHE